MKRLLLLSGLTAALVSAVPASAQDTVDTSVQFTLGRVVHLVPDNRDRIGIRSLCDDEGGCKVNYTLRRGSSLLGGTQALLLPKSIQTDYINLTKRAADSLRRKRATVTITADARDAVGNKKTFTKIVVLGPKKKRR